MAYLVATKNDPHSHETPCVWLCVHRCNVAGCLNECAQLSFTRRFFASPFDFNTHKMNYTLALAVTAKMNKMKFSGLDKIYRLLAVGTTASEFNFCFTSFSC